MKKVIVLGLLIIGAVYGGPNIQAFLGFGPGRLGISTSDPLGTPVKLHQALIADGFDGSLGEVGKPRTMKFSPLKQDKSMPGAEGSILVTVGEDEYVQKVSGVYLNTQHQNSPQRITPTDAWMQRYWRNFWSDKPHFKRELAGQMSIPVYGGIKINSSHSVATASNADLKGAWEYSDDSPMEAMQIELK